MKGERRDKDGGEEGEQKTRQEADVLYKFQQGSSCRGEGFLIEHILKTQPFFIVCTEGARSTI